MNNEKNIIIETERLRIREYTTEDFHFNFKGIEYFYNLKELDINLLGGEAFKRVLKPEGKNDKVIDTGDRWGRTGV